MNTVNVCLLKSGLSMMFWDTDVTSIVSSLISVMLYYKFHTNKFSVKHTSLQCVFINNHISLEKPTQSFERKKKPNRIINYNN